MELTSQFLDAYDDSEKIDDTRYVPSSNMSPWLAVLDKCQSVEWETKG